MSTSIADFDIVTATVREGKTYDTGFAAASAEGNAWFPQLPAARQAEVVKYAVLHITNNSSLFERNKHDGNDQVYERLAIAIARSGVTDAETIFVEAASSAKDADPEDQLRRFFQSFTCADPSDGITVGTLLNAARRCGADFKRWETIFDSRGREVHYFPGNEEACRKLLDQEVAADPRTYTLGEPTGPLVILRAPNKDALPPKTKWEGDLPGTTLAMTADIMQRAERLKWMQRGGGKSESEAPPATGRRPEAGTAAAGSQSSGPKTQSGSKRVDRTGPPRAFVGDYLIQMRGQYGAPPFWALHGSPVSTTLASSTSFPGTTPQQDYSTIGHPTSTFR
jgi:hypothetical protein